MEMSQQDENSSVPPAATQPLPFDLKVNKLIMQHLSGADFLKLSEVSTAFSTYVNNYQMDTIRLLINETSERKLDVEALLYTKRHYKHIKIEKLVYAQHSVADLFRRFAYTLTSIHTGYDVALEGGHLPCVKSLIMVLGDGSNGYRENGLLSAVANLETLLLQGRHGSPMELVNCLSNNNNLKKLTLEKNAQDSFFNNRKISKLSLQLESFKLDSTQFVDMSEANFERFLAGSTTLKEIKVLKCSYPMLTKLFNSSALSVESLTFSPPAAHNDPFYYFCDFHMNENITYLGLILVNEPLLAQMLPKLPRLTTLYVSDPTPRMFKYIINVSPSLKEFRFAYFREAYYSLELVRAIYHREVSAGNPNVTKDLIITQI